MLQKKFRGSSLTLFFHTEKPLAKPKPFPLGKILAKEKGGLFRKSLPIKITKIGRFAFDGCFGGDYGSRIDLAENIAVVSDGMQTITIPHSVERVGEYAFCRCGLDCIYCEAKAQPDGWHTDWNPDNIPVVWGFSNSEK
jgi:hypothetical protein